jgi:hypothetical protein
MKKVIIAIHGLGNKPAADQLRAWWLEALQEGLARAGHPHAAIPFEMVYWADIAYAEPLEADAVTEPYAPSPGSPGKQRRRSMRMALLGLAERYMDRLFLRKDFTETFPAASARMMEHYFTELDIYYTDECRSLQNEDCSAKAAMQARLRSVLLDHAGHKVLLIAHSMGSIIAFDVLSDPAGGLAVDTFITLGSPLGLPPIVARNFQAQQAVRPRIRHPHAPDAVWPHWYNLSDPRDTVALDHTLRDDYAPNRRGVRAIDFSVVNDYEANGESNPHKSYGYLRTPEVAEIIDAFLAGHGKGFLQRHYRRIAAATQRIWKGISG